MSRGVYAQRVDGNQKQLTALFRQMGVSVQLLHTVGCGCPDILLGLTDYRGKRVNILVELKDGAQPLSAQKLTMPEVEFFGRWKGQVCIVRSVDEAKELINKYRFPSDAV